MHLNIDHIADIIVKHIQGKCTDAELQELDRWAKSDPRHETLLQELLDSEKTKARLRTLKEFDADMAWQKLIDQGVVQGEPVRRFAWRSMLSAAALLLFGTLSFLFWWDRQPAKPEEVLQRVVETAHPKYKNDVLPAIEGATLITAEGEAISLSETITVQEDGVVRNESNDAIANLEQADALVYNELVVPQTNYFSFQLSDGTKVWINANSRLSFPSRFAGDERKVRLLEGEAYFEVAKRQHQPFIVETSKANVRVLGTQFNVRNYKNSFATTLAEGSVEVYNDTQLQKLSPNQKAFFKSET